MISHVTFTPRLQMHFIGMWTALQESIEMVAQDAVFTKMKTKTPSTAIPTTTDIDILVTIRRNEEICFPDIKQSSWKFGFKSSDIYRLSNVNTWRPLSI